jgi:hypothetical protein
MSTKDWVLVGCVIVFALIVSVDVGVRSGLLPGLILFIIVGGFGLCAINSPPPKKKMRPKGKKY